MRIDNYAVAMDAQYFSVALTQTDASVSTTTQNFQDKDSKVEQVNVVSEPKNSVSDELSAKLSNALLKNLSGESQRFTQDIVEINHTYVEAQALDFHTKALVQADGREYEISLDVSLSRSFVEQTKIVMQRDSYLKDPLVISLNGLMPTLSSNSFAFDIDSDGEHDQISKLSSGNGFLALDKNSNGFIDDGSELFGTKSGDGFSDLSKYDDDKNGWIDENDAIFDKLRIWEKTDSKDKLIGLGEVGIGAIFLGNTNTPFSLKSDSNELLGEIRKSGFFIYENGKAGVISQIDLAVNSKTKEDLNKLDTLQKNLFTKNVNTLYKKGSQESEDSTDTQMQKLQSEMKALETKLAHADEKQKPDLQARIGELFAQMMSILEAEIA